MNRPKVLAILALVAVSLQAQTDPFIGTWKLNVEKSHYSPGPAPKSQVSVWALKGKGVRITTTGIGADGKPTSQDTTAQYDGKDYPTIGNPDYDTTSFKRIDANTLQLIRKQDGRVVQNATIAVSQDGTTRTITTLGTNAAGKPINNVSVYERQ